MGWNCWRHREIRLRRPCPFIANYTTGWLHHLGRNKAFACPRCSSACLLARPDREGRPTDTAKDREREREKCTRNLQENEPRYRTPTLERSFAPGPGRDLDELLITKPRYHQGVSFPANTIKMTGDKPEHASFDKGDSRRTENYTM